VRRKLLPALAVLMAALSAVVACAASPAGAVSPAAAAPAGAGVAAAGAAGAAGAGAASTSASALLLELNGVSCVSRTFCAAVGIEGNSDLPAKGNVPLAMIWTGTRWRQTSVPMLKGEQQGAALYGVSCRSARYCVAVGSYVSGAGVHPMAETWNGKAWQPAALPRPATGVLLGAGAVSCPAVGRCVATGINVTPSEADRPFIDTLNGTKWTTRDVPMPRGGTTAIIAAVDCVSASYCVLAGTYNIKQPPGVLFESWNGRSFSVLKAATPGAPDLAVNGASCASATDCVAVGVLEKPPLYSGTSFAERWNGRSWSLISQIGPQEPKNPKLFGLSCASASWCVAVGLTSANGSFETSHALAVSYDGKTWKVASVPAPAGVGSTFTAVSCASATDCVAVGWRGGPDSPLASSTAFTAVWNGTTWRAVAAAV
jgi:hypothetical protein